MKITIEKDDGEIRVIEDVTQFVLLVDVPDGIRFKLVSGRKFLGYAAAHIQSEFTDALINR